MTRTAWRAAAAGGLGYGIGKGVLLRVAGILALEVADTAIRTYSVLPGFIATERMSQDMAEFGFDAASGPPPDVVGAAVAWILAHPDPAEGYTVANGRNVEAQEVCVSESLLPDWPTPDRPPAYQGG